MMSQALTNASSTESRGGSKVRAVIERSRILSWGAQVEVLQPADLRADVAATYRAAAERYENARA